MHDVMSNPIPVLIIHNRILLTNELSHMYICTTTCNYSSVHVHMQKYIHVRVSFRGGGGLPFGS